MDRKQTESKNKPLKILVVEDAKLWRTALEDFFGELGYLLRSCDDGMVALELIESERPDVIILDYLLPRIDGNRICSFVKGSPDLRSIVTIILTGAVVGGYSREHMAAADAVIAKGPLSVTLNACQKVLKDLLSNKVNDYYEKEIVQPSHLSPREMTLKVIKLKDYIETLQLKLTDAIIEVDDRLRIVRVNPAAMKTLTKSEASLLGLDLVKILGLKATSPLHQALRAAMSQSDSFNPGPYEHCVGDKYLETTVSLIPYVFDKWGIVLICRDITTRKETERALQETEEQLRQAQKLETIGRYSSGLSHDFSNILTVVSGYAELIEKNPRNEKYINLGAREIQKAADRGLYLIRRLLTYSRQQASLSVPVDVNAVIFRMEGMIRSLVETDISLSFDYGQHLRLVKSDPHQLEQAILNLVVNARDAMPDGGQLTVRTEISPDHEAAGDPSRRKIRISVRDTGQGIAAEVLPHIFKSFYTTKTEGKGTGLGLSIVSGIVEKYNGTIDVETSVGVGSTFTITLDSCEDELPATPVDDEVILQQRGSETILMAEDDRHVSEVLTHFLGEQGYTVLAAANGNEALSLADSHSGPIQMLLTDIVMPKMNGFELSQKLLEQFPALKIVYLSGYSEDDLNQRGSLNPNSRLLTKPVQLVSLLRAIRELLDRGIEI